MIESEKSVLLVLINPQKSSDNIDNDSIIEGGMSRNTALFHWLITNAFATRQVNVSQSKLKNIISFSIGLIRSKNSTIILQYPFPYLPLFGERFLNLLFRTYFFTLLKYVSRANNVIIDISDIKYEQGMDLEIEEQCTETIRRFESHLFRLPVKFIFASSSMREYVCGLHKVNKQDTDVCINGGDRLKKTMLTEVSGLISPEKINYVYAGTLNRGRQIKKLLCVFPRNSNYSLYLLGPGGEWITKESVSDNIHYLGAMPEKEAHVFVSKCDIGLIPYDEKRMYYNIAYPTKLSFYITAGIPFLSTPVNEVVGIQRKYGIGYISEISGWNLLISKTSREDITAKKLMINEVMDHFYWTTIFGRSAILQQFVAGDHS